MDKISILKQQDAYNKNQIESGPSTQSLPLPFITNDFLYQNSFSLVDFIFSINENEEPIDTSLISKNSQELIQLSQMYADYSPDFCDDLLSLESGEYEIERLESYEETVSRNKLIDILLEMKEKGCLSDISETEIKRANIQELKAWLEFIHYWYLN
jgi:hypothetical protein